MYSDPLAYFLTFRTYGTWLPGDKRGSTRSRPAYSGSKQYDPSDELEQRASNALRNPPVILTDAAREIVRCSIERTCQRSGWKLLAVNVRSNHVHAVVSSDRTPERTMSSLKSWATNALRNAAFAAADQRVWARHGSTIYLFKEEELKYARWYTLEAQEGERFEAQTNNDPS